jgi:hypothetical protein
LTAAGARVVLMVFRFLKQGAAMTTYENATAGTRARNEISKVLRSFGCESVGFMDDYQQHEVILAFKHRGRQVQMPVSAKGWAQRFLKEQPWNYKRHSTKQEWEQKALQQGHIAVNSALRDWVKGSLTAIEAGICSFESVFGPHMITADGRPLIERVAELLPKPDEPKVVALPAQGR